MAPVTAALLIASLLAHQSCCGAQCKRNTGTDEVGRGGPVQGAELQAPSHQALQNSLRIMSWSTESHAARLLIQSWCQLFR